MVQETALEMRQVGKPARGFKSHHLRHKPEIPASCGCFWFLAKAIWDSDPRGRERKREVPVALRAASGPKATVQGAEDEACEHSEAGGRIPLKP